MITIQKRIEQPNRVFLPLTDNLYKIANVHVEEGESVTIGQVVAHQYKGAEKRPVLATVSGTVSGFKQLLDRYNNIVDHIIIDNDAKNRLSEYDAFPEDVSTAQIRNRIEDFNLETVTVDGNYTSISFDQPVNHIVINAIFTNEPFVSIDYERIIEYADDIIDGVNLLAKAAKTDSKTIIIDKYMEEEAVQALEKASEEQGIELVTVDVKKVNGWDYSVIEKLVDEQLTNDLLDVGVIYTDIDAILYVEQAVRKAMPPTMRRVAVTGDGLKQNAIYTVRIGTPFTSIVDDLGGYNGVDTLNLHLGNYITGKQVEHDGFSIVQSIDNVHASQYYEIEEDVCIKCGDCNDICPAGILPQNIMDAEIREVASRIFELDTDACVECGLCTYVCPSKINVLEWVRRAKRRTV